MRYALYFAPPADHPLHALSAAWLGRDAVTGMSVPQPETALPQDELATVTRSPRRYGFHATLAPPFELAPGCDLAALDSAVAGLAARLAPAPLPLRLGRIGGFLALVPAAFVPEVAEIAAACVGLADGFRARPAPEELARRRAAGLTTRQEALLQRWGYPYVLEEFRFHMTLSERLEEPRQGRVMAALQAHLADITVADLLAPPVVLDALTLFVEREPGGDFRHHRRYPFPAGRQAGTVRNVSHA